MIELSNIVGWAAAVLLLSSFVKFTTVLSMLRIGLGVHGSGFGIMIVAVSFALSLVVLEPRLASVGGSGVLLTPVDPSRQAVIERELRPFLLKNADADILQRFQKLEEEARKGASAEQPSSEAAVVPAAEQASFGVLAASFLITEVSEAFMYGVLLLIPFLIIDLLAANVLALLNVQQLSVSMVTVPLKLLLFAAVNGWALLSEKLVAGYV